MSGQIDYGSKCERCGEASWGKPVCFRCRVASGEYNGHAAMAQHEARVSRAFASVGDHDNAARAARKSALHAEAARR